MATPNFEGLPFDLVLTHSILLVPYYDKLISESSSAQATGFNVVAYGPNPNGTSIRGSEPRHTIGTATTYEEADAIRTPAWAVVHAARRLKGVG